MTAYVLSIDQGTTCTTCLIVDKSLVVKARVSQEFQHIFPKPGWVEHNLENIWATVETTISKAMRQAGIKPHEIAAIGIANQRETVGIWDRRSGRPLANAIVWQCRRTAEVCEELRRAGHEPLVRERTGLLLDPYFSATKLSWLLDQVKGARMRAERGDLAFGTIDAFLIWRLTRGAVHATDVSNASRTSLLDLRSLTWDKEMLSIFGIPQDVLPQVRGSSEVFGVTKAVRCLPDGIPVAGVMGDQQAALFGQACFDPGDAKCTYGTGAFLLMNVGTTPVFSKSRMLSTVAWKIGSEVTYALEGSSFVAGSAVQWLRDNLKMITRAPEIETLAKTVKDSGEVVFVPALCGLGAPHWRPEARGLFYGLSQNVNSGHLARAVLEGIAFAVHDLAQAIQEDTGRQMTAIKVDGGVSSNDLVMQFQSDLLGIPVIRPRVIETTALGAALAAGLAAGFWAGKEDIRKACKTDKKYTPRIKAEDRTRHLERWRHAVSLA